MGPAADLQTKSRGQGEGFSLIWDEAFQTWTIGIIYINGHDRDILYIGRMSMYKLFLSKSYLKAKQDDFPFFYSKEWKKYCNKNSYTSHTMSMQGGNK